VHYVVEVARPVAFRERAQFFGKHLFKTIRKHFDSTLRFVGIGVVDVSALSFENNPFVIC